MDKYLIFDKHGFYGKHIAADDIDKLFLNYKELNKQTELSDFQVLYLIYEFEDFYQSLQLKSELREKLVFVLMDDALKKKFKYNLKIKIYSYRKTFNLLKNRFN